MEGGGVSSSRGEEMADWDGVSTMVSLRIGCCC